MVQNKAKRKLSGIGSFLVGLFTTFIVVGPLYWLIVTSLKTEAEIYQIPPTVVPVDLTFENFKYAIYETKVLQYLLNSVIYTVGTLVIVLICVCLAGYAMSRFRFRGKKGYLLAILLSQLMPLTTLMVPLYISMGKMNLLNNRFAIILVYSAIQIPIALWLLLGYFNGIPREIDEAATIDGCNKFQILTKMIVPLSKPGLMAVGLSVAISVWQELLMAITFINVDKLRPIMAGISSSITKAGVRWGQVNATALIVIIPVIFIYVFCQKYLVRGLTGGAVKG